MNFNCTKTEMDLIGSIVDRAFSLDLVKVNALTANMDITAAHCNGSPLDLEALLAADNFNFSHDFTGIVGHMNRNTGKLERGFSPRFSKANQQTSSAKE